MRLRVRGGITGHLHHHGPLWGHSIRMDWSAVCMVRRAIHMDCGSIRMGSV